jgi:hypothetical protein
VRLTEAQKAVILRHARQDAIEHLELIRDDLEDERRESLMTVLDYVAELEKTTAARNEDIGRLQGELGKALARIAELEAAQQWQPIMADEEHSGHYKTIRIRNVNRCIEYSDYRISNVFV